MGHRQWGIDKVVMAMLCFELYKDIESRSDTGFHSLRPKSAQHSKLVICAVKL